MNIVSGIVVFVIVWALVLFTVLPLGVERQKTVIPGADPGAPDNPRMWKKVGLTTAITIVIWLIFYAVATSNLISFRD
jgi:predicted secreted protein